MARAKKHYIPDQVRSIKTEILVFISIFFRFFNKLLWPDPRLARLVLTPGPFQTSNHIHLLVVDTQKNVLPKSIQLLAGRTGREPNRLYEYLPRIIHNHMLLKLWF